MSDDDDLAHQAAHTLSEHLIGPLGTISPVIQAIGVGTFKDGKPTLASEGGIKTIVVMTKVKRHRLNIPPEWEGYPVIETHVGKIEIRPPKRGE